jgi:hypothetical protein
MQAIFVALQHFLRCDRKRVGSAETALETLSEQAS